MIILIDGYNVLKQLVPQAAVTDKERRDFITILGKYARRKKHTLILVFDGGPYDWAHKERISHITVIYSGMHETADQLIMHYLDDHQTKDLFLVSSDNELGLFASALEIPSIGSEDFFSLVKQALKGAAPIENNHEPVTLSNDATNLDQIMEEGSKSVPIKPEDVEPSQVRSSSSKRSSKLERKLYQKLKKL